MNEQDRRRNPDIRRDDNKNVAGSEKKVVNIICSFSIFIPDGSINSVMCPVLIFDKENFLPYYEITKVCIMPPSPRISKDYVIEFVAPGIKTIYLASITKEIFYTLKNPDYTEIGITDISIFDKNNPDYPNVPIDRVRLVEREF